MNSSGPDQLLTLPDKKPRVSLCPLHGAKWSQGIFSERFLCFSDKTNKHQRRAAESRLCQEDSAEPFPASSPARRAAYARAASWLNRALHHPERMRLAVTCRWANPGDADKKKGAYPARAKPSVLVTLRMKRNPERRQPMRCMSCPSRCAPGCAARPSLALWWDALAPTACLALQRGTLQPREERCERVASVPIR